ncbi:MAG: hypothetical protein KJO69_05520 [Gammaproteobacteria bacterium]|nr:hypothetical protein [Gammaproteobacteria bacterium]
MNGYLSVKNWDKFQHYKDRNPPWIKLHRDLLRDYEFACLQDASKLLLIELWLLASQLDNKIPNDDKWLARQIPYNGKINTKPLIDNGFIELVQDDSNTLAGCKQVAMPEAEAEAEAKTETEQRPRKTRLQPDWILPDDYREYCKTKRPDLCPDATAENFKDYFIGEGKLMMDWKRTWQRWVRKEHGTTRKAGNGASTRTVQTPADRHEEAVRRRQDSNAPLG